MNATIDLFGKVCQSTLQKCRTFTRTARSLGPATGPEMDLGAKHTPSALDKKMLVWTKMFKSVEEVPATVSYATMRKTRDLMRIRVNIGMAVATVVGCVIVIGYSRSRQGDGDSLHLRGLMWQEQMREKGKEERAAKSSDTST